MDDFATSIEALQSKSRDELIEIITTLSRVQIQPAEASSETPPFDLEKVVVSLVEDSMVPMIVVDDEGTVRHLNRALLDMTGYDAADYLNAKIGHRTHPNDTNETQDLRRGLIAGIDVTGTVEKKIVRKDGTVLSCRVKRLVVRDNVGKIRFLVSEIIDLTDQQNQMRELYRQRTLFETLFWEMPEALVFINPDRTIRMCNTAFSSLFGYQVGELHGLSTRVLYADDESFDRQGRYNERATRQIQSNIIPFIRKDRSIFTGENIGTLVRDHDGEAIGLIGLVRDITERDRVLRMLVDSERRFRDFAQAGAYRFWETDAQGRYTYLSPANRYFPNSEELLIGRNQFKSPNFYYDDADIKRVLDHIARHEPYQDFHHSVSDERGRRFRASSGVPVYDADGAFCGYRGVSIDETGEVLARREAETLSARFYAAIENFHAGFALWSADRRFVSCNEFYRRATGPCATELRPGVEFKDFIRARAQQIHVFREIDPEAWAADRIADFEKPITSHDYLDPDGTWYRITKQRLANGDSLFFMADITAGKFREDEMLAAKLAAEAASYAKSEFLSNVSHELRTPLNAILGFAQIFERASPTMTTEKFARFGGIIRENGAYLLDLINGILDLSAIEAGRLTLIEEEVELAELVEDAVQLVRVRAADDNIALTNTIGRSAPSVSIDRIKMKQVLANILMNAVKFTPSGGAIELSFQHNDNVLDILISDTGIGMTDEEISLALEKFGRIGRSQKSARDGLGLGLPLAKELVEAHGGRLVLSSVPNSGTVVTISLPSERIVS